MATALLVPDQKPFTAGPALSNAPRSLNLFGGHMTIHADSHDTLGGFSLIEMSGPTGSEPPLHVHSREDELFYVLDGELSVRRGYETLVLKTGQSAFLARNVPHTFKISSGSARWLTYITPGGFEEYFRAVAASFGANQVPAASPAAFERMAAVAARHGITFIS